MSANKKAKVVLCWHMHQPYYRTADDGEYILPWTYLHAIKDYVDMAAIIAAYPKARAVVNFAPILLEQLDDYSKQIKAHLSTKSPITDGLLAALAVPQLSLQKSDRIKLINECIRANEERLVNRFEPFRKLVEIARQFIKLEDSVSYLSEQYIFDLITWYHIAWMGETVRRQNPLISRLMAKQKNFSFDDRIELLRLIGDLVASVIPSYKALAASGQVELAFSPYAHPIVPLLLNFHSARESAPEGGLPESAYYPGGEERSSWHIQYGLQTFEKYFGITPRGCWPSEGGVSEASLRLYDQYKIQWIATGESVLRNSLRRSGNATVESNGVCLHRAYRLPERKVNCFFRDDGLSDLIGFSYSRWHADDAVANLTHHIKNIVSACASDDTVISIILDGENAWEYYPENGYYFLTALYDKLSQQEDWELTTFSACIDAKVEPVVLEHLVAGSWVYGTFSTWIGDGEKNRAWDILCEAKRQFDMAVSQQRLKGKQLEQAMQQLAICEGSDWFWWFGDYNPAVSVSEFDRLFRLHIAALYQLVGIAVPPSLSQVISRGGGSPAAGGVMRPGS